MADCALCGGYLAPGHIHSCPADWPPHGYIAAKKDAYDRGLEDAAKRLETANDETSRVCIIEAIRGMKLSQ
jgi:hypothetical protein